MGSGHLVLASLVLLVSSLVQDQAGMVSRLRY